MILKKYIEFINESISIHEGDFKVTSDMVSNGKMILEKIPREVTGVFDCSELELTSLEGSPKSVGGNFYCYNNQLVSLEGCPKSVGGYFDCSDNNLLSLEGCHKSVNRSIYCYNNKVNLTIEKVFIESEKYINEYWVDLLKYMISNNIELTEITSWPKDFITDNTIQSVKGLNKFKL